MSRNLTPGPSLPVGNIISGVLDGSNYPNPAALADTTVTPGNYTNPTSLTVGADGRLTDASSDPFSYLITNSHILSVTAGTSIGFGAPVAPLQIITSITGTSPVTMTASPAIAVSNDGTIINLYNATAKTLIIPASVGVLFPGSSLTLLPQQGVALQFSTLESGWIVTGVVSDTGITAGGYGNSDLTLEMIVDSDGRISTIMSAPIQIVESQVTGLATALANTVNLTGGQTVAGIKAFSSSPTVPNGVGSTDAVNVTQLQAVAGQVGTLVACQTVATTNITLSGLQTINGYTTLAGDRVLCIDQTSNVNNGTYLASSVGWSRTTDSFENGITVPVESGTYAQYTYICTGTNPIVIGVSALPFATYAVPVSYPITPALGGTGLGTTSPHYLLVTDSSTTMGVIGTGTSGALLIDQGSGFDPAFEPLSGDATLTNAGVLTLDAVNTNIGTFGAANKYTVVTVNGKGLVTAASDGTINISGADVTSGTVSPTYGGTGVSNPTVHGVVIAEGSSAMVSVTGSDAQLLLAQSGADPAFVTMSGDATIADSGALALKNTGTAGTNGSASAVPVFTTDAQGRVTSNTNTAIAIAGTQITSGLVSPTVGGTGITNPTAHGVLIAEGSSAMSAVTGTAGQILIAQTSADPAFESMSGDVQITNAGVTTVVNSTFQPKDIYGGLKAWSYDPMLANSGGVTNAGFLQGTMVILREAASITNILIQQLATGSSLTSGENFVGLYSVSGTTATLIASSADQHSDWSTTTGLKTIPLAAGPFSCPAGVYYVVILSNGGSTQPSFNRQGSLTTEGGYGYVAGTYRWWLSNAGSMVTMPSPTYNLTNSLSGGSTYWVGLS